MRVVRDGAAWAKIPSDIRARRTGPASDGRSDERPAVGSGSPPRETWGVQIRMFRRQRLLKQAALAAMLDIDQASVSRWERDIGIPPERVQRRLRGLLRTAKTPDQVLKYSVESSFFQVLLADRHRVIWTASTSYCEGHGISRPEIIGLSTRPQFTDSVHQIWNETTQQGFYQGEIAAVRYAARAHTLDGRRDLAIQVLWTPVFLSDGTVLKRTERTVLSEIEFSKSPLKDRPVVTMTSDLFQA